jgi:hypothetical protein
MVMDSGPYPFGRTALYVVPSSESRPRVFKSKEDAMAVLTDRNGRVFEFVETNRGHEYFLAYVHDRDGETRVMDMTTTDEGTAAKYFPDVTALSYDRYGSLVSFVRGLEEYKAFYERVQDSELRTASRTEGGRSERVFLEALREAGRKLAYKSGGYVALDEMDELHMSYLSE